VEVVARCGVAGIVDDEGGEKGFSPVAGWSKPEDIGALVCA
jgi:hypothetical protein